MGLSTIAMRLHGRFMYICCTVWQHEELCYDAYTYHLNKHFHQPAQNCQRNSQSLPVVLCFSSAWMTGLPSNCGNSPRETGTRMHHNIIRKTRIIHISKCPPPSPLLIHDETQDYASAPHKPSPPPCLAAPSTAYSALPYARPLYPAA